MRKTFDFLKNKILVVKLSFFRDDIDITWKKLGNVWKPNLEFENILQYQSTEAYGVTASYSLWYYSG